MLRVGTAHQFLMNIFSYNMIGLYMSNNTLKNE